MIVSKSFCAAFVMLQSLSARFLIGYGFVSRDNLKYKCVCPLGSSDTAGFLIVNIVESSERIQSLLTHLTPQNNLRRQSLDPPR